MNNADPSLLAEKCLAGDEQAIELFVRTYETGVFRLALSIVQDPAAANEVTQETFIAAIRSLRTYRERSSLKAWVYTIALNTSRSHMRKQKVMEKLRSTLTSLLPLEQQRQSSPEEVLLQNEKEAAIFRSLEALDEKHRIVILLRYFQDLSVAEIAEILSMNEGTVHSRLHTARERLKISLTGLDGE